MRVEEHVRVVMSEGVRCETGDRRSVCYSLLQLETPNLPARTSRFKIGGYGANRISGCYTLDDQQLILEIFN